MNNIPHVIGLDQGGSGTRAVICGLDWRLLGKGFGPGACHTFDGMPAALQGTQTAVAAACAQAGLQPGGGLAFVGGYTGADWPDEYELLAAAVQSIHMAETVTIVNDCIAALRGGTQQPYGAILVAGTGANCAVRAPDGREYIYHYYHDDHLQGGGALGRAALQAIFRAETGRPPQTTLRQPVLNLYALPDVDALMRSLVEGRLPSRRLPEIAPLVFAEAENGDDAARQIVIRFAEGCAELVVNGLRRLGMLDLDVEVVLSGGIFKASSPLLRQTLADALYAQAPLTHLVHARYEPAVGSALLALEKLGILMNDTTQMNLEASAQALGLVRLEQ